MSVLTRPGGRRAWCEGLGVDGDDWTGGGWVGGEL